MPQPHRPHHRSAARIDLAVREGEILGFLGPNGAGKSTTLRMLTTLLAPTGGTASVAGCDLVTDPVGVRRAGGYVAQSSGVDPNIGVREEPVTQGRLYRLTKDQAGARAEELARELDFADLLGRKAGALSGGQRRRLDPGSRADLWDLIRRLRGALTALIYGRYLRQSLRSRFAHAVPPSGGRGAGRVRRLVHDGSHAVRRAGGRRSLRARRDGGHTCVPDGRSVITLAAWSI
ncbi:ATP-binding cassette domain-containing protein [Streptomyces sp. NPDC006476]|uniref:ATP-binding cassette domain-containing protein n=1 Tax=Streptomyces sp. NPDC006476 TaxID=3157175 RepID=UPI00339E1830